MLFAWFISLLQWLLVVIAAPMLVGAIRKTKARLQGRRGPRIWQPYADLRKLLIKETVISESTSWIFRFTQGALERVCLLPAAGSPAD